MVNSGEHREMIKQIVKWFQRQGTYTHT